MDSLRRAHALVAAPRHYEPESARAQIDARMFSFFGETR